MGSCLHAFERESARNLQPSVCVCGRLPAVKSVGGGGRSCVRNSTQRDPHQRSPVGEPAPLGERRFLPPALCDRSARSPRACSSCCCHGSYSSASRAPAEDPLHTTGHDRLHLAGGLQQSGCSPLTQDRTGCTVSGRQWTGGSFGEGRCGSCVLKGECGQVGGECECEGGPVRA